MGDKKNTNGDEKCKLLKLTQVVYNALVFCSNKLNQENKNMKLSPTKIASAISLSVYSLAANASQVMAQSVGAGGAGAGAGSKKVNVGEIKGPAGFAADLGTVITTALSFVMGIAVLLVFFYLIWGGIQWITSGGEKGKTEEARNKITTAVIGLIVLAASYAILKVALSILGFTTLTSVLDITSITTNPSGQPI